MAKNCQGTRAAKLKIGQTLKIPVDAEADIVAIRNRLGAVVRRKIAPQFEKMNGPKGPKATNVRKL